MRIIQNIKLDKRCFELEFTNQNFSTILEPIQKEVFIIGLTFRLKKLR